jgi:hypothetical protein
MAGASPSAAPPARHLPPPPSSSSLYADAVAGRGGMAAVPSQSKPTRPARKARPPPPHPTAPPRCACRDVRSAVAGRIRRATATEMTSLPHNSRLEGLPESGAPSTATRQHRRREAREGSDAEQVLLY